MYSTNFSPLSESSLRESALKREKEELERKLNNCLKENSILTKQLGQWKRDHGELILSQRETQDGLTESRLEYHRLREAMEGQSLELQRLKSEKEEIEVKLSKEVQILRKQLGNLKEENGEWVASKAAMEAELRRLREENQRVKEEKKEICMREKEAEGRCKVLMAELEKAEKQRKEMEPLAQKNKKLERDLEVVMDAATARFKELEKRLSKLERNVAVLSDSAGLPLAGTVDITEKPESFESNAKTGKLTRSQIGETTASEEKTASSMPCTHKSALGPTLICVSDDDEEELPSSKKLKRVELDDKCHSFVVKPVVTECQNIQNKSGDSDKAWEYEADMLAALQRNTELCLKAVCALYRHRGFKLIYALRGTALAEFLMGGDAKGEMKRSLVDLEKFDPKGADDCKRIAFAHSQQLFEIYKNTHDPFFAP